ncbi:CBS domain-containing protein [Roseospira goensis]|uniref:CBS domain-containing protein n=1 Tax=Roseospira goensis TaxID=391922 RepID=A0A7W6RZM1_9PROT|nr:CBS domain-containing protein [Roseospira goensis]MBB4285655.1 CBS domain-containing protein [Roseospira goensis]
MNTDTTNTESNPLLGYRMGDCSPSELLTKSDLSGRDKLAVLRQWEYDAIELMVAEEENMGGGRPAPLSEIRDAIRSLRTDRGDGPARTGQSGGPMTVADVMTRTVKTVHSDNRIRDVARQMRTDGVGLYVVLDGDEAVGMVTDRDIVARAVADRVDLDARPVADIMTNRIVACAQDAPLSEAADLMMREGVRRLCVVDAAGDLAGILSVTDLALDHNGEATIGRVLRAIVQAPAASAPDPDKTTSRHGAASHPGGLQVYSLRPRVRR